LVILLLSLTWHTSPRSAVCTHYFTITDPRKHFCLMIPGKSLQLLSVPFFWNDWPSFLVTSLPKLHWLWRVLHHSHWINGFSGSAAWYRQIPGDLRQNEAAVPQGTSQDLEVISLKVSL